MISIKEINSIVASSRLLQPAYVSEPVCGDALYEQKKGIVFARSFYSLNEFYTIILKKPSSRTYILNCDYMYVHFDDMSIIDNKDNHGVSYLLFLKEGDVVCKIIV